VYRRQSLQASFVRLPQSKRRPLNLILMIPITNMRFLFRFLESLNQAIYTIKGALDLELLCSYPLVNLLPLMCRALLSSELESIFANAPPNPEDLATQRIQQAYAKATGTSSSADTPSESESKNKKRLPQEGDACPVWLVLWLFFASH
jgi:hypothetical protein